MYGFSQIQQILDTAVGGPDADVFAPHLAFWRDTTRDEFVAFEFAGVQIITLNDGAGSGIVKALRGQFPFGKDTGTPGAQFRRMPAGKDPVPDDQIAIIAQWIDAGCPAEADATDPAGTGTTDPAGTGTTTGGTSPPAGGPAGPAPGTAAADAPSSAG